MKRRIWGTLIVLHAALLSSPAHAQGYGQYGYEMEEASGPSLLQRIFTSPAASLLMIFTGAMGIFIFATASGKGERSERRQAYGVICIFAVIVMFWYRFSLWNNADYNSR